MNSIEKLTEKELLSERVKLEDSLNKRLLTFESAERLYLGREALKRIESLRKINS